MTLFQNLRMRKTIGAVKGSSAEKVNTIAVVEAVMTIARVAGRRILARTMCHPFWAGIVLVDGSLTGLGELSTGECAGGDKSW